MEIKSFLYSKNNYINSGYKSSKNITFQKAYVNILSMGDNHGRLTTLPNLFEIIKINFDKIFPNAKSQNTLNMIVNVGDMLMNPKKKGFITRIGSTSGDIQFSVFKKFISSIEAIFKKGHKVNHSKVVSVYTPGNHCFEGGINWLFKKIRNSKFHAIITNAKFPKSKSISSHKVYSVPDDKNTHLKHKLLVLGFVPPNTDFYVPKPFLNGITITDSCKKPDVLIDKSDLTDTIMLFRQIISDFKKKHPKGAVVLNSHAGNHISEIIAQEIQGINLILNGHDHKDSRLLVNGVNIISNGKDNKFVVGTKLFFDDEGNPSISDSQKFSAEGVAVSKNNPISLFLKTRLKKDLKPRVKIKGIKGGLDLKEDGIRHQNSTLANLVTDIVYEELRMISPTLNAAGIISSTFRGGLRQGANNLEILKVLDGSLEDFSEMCFARIKGSSLLEILSDNISLNLKNPQKNSIIQWSGIITDRSLFAQLEKDTPQRISEAFKIRSTHLQGEDIYEEINPNKYYTISLSKKYVTKYCPENLKRYFRQTGQTLNNMFARHLEQHDYQITITAKTREERIINSLPAVA